jgi:hypothetical protein
LEIASSFEATYIWNQRVDFRNSSFFSEKHFFLSNLGESFDKEEENKSRDIDPVLGPIP